MFYFYTMSFLNNKVVWITGASSGIGAELAKQCANQGAKIILSARNQTLLNEVEKTLQGKEHIVLPFDLNQTTDYPYLAKQVIDRFGKIDYLFNNGGVSQRASVSETSIEIDRQIMEVNYFGNIALTKAALPYMIEQKSGHIIITSSIAGKFGFYLRSAYSASKFALQGFYESLALEEAKNNIHITLAFPGKIQTNISMHALNGKGEKHNQLDNNQATGMAVEKCAHKLLRAVEQQKPEVLIGNKETLAVTLRRFLPQKLFWRIIKNQSPT